MAGLIVGVVIWLVGLAAVVLIFNQGPASLAASRRRHKDAPTPASRET